MNSSDTTPARVSGSCLCGAVRYQVRGPMRPVVCCHCDMCRKTSGHYVAATATRTKDFELLEDRGLKWYRSSPIARRAFCRECGQEHYAVRQRAGDAQRAIYEPRELRDRAREEDTQAGFLVIGDTVETMQEIYANQRVIFSTDAKLEAIYEINSASSGTRLLWGPVEGEDASDRIIGIYAPDVCNR